jgi:hypothetical protein
VTIAVPPASIPLLSVTCRSWGTSE